jgi:hypothetical protein
VVTEQRDHLVNAHKKKDRVAAHLFGIGGGVCIATALQLAPRYKNIDPKAVMAVGGVAAYAVVTPTVAWYLRTDDDYGTKEKAPEVTQNNKKRLSWTSVLGGAAFLGAAGCAGYQCAKRYGCNQNQTVAATLAGSGALWAAARVKNNRARKKAAREQADRDGRIYGNPEYVPGKE